MSNSIIRLVCIEGYTGFKYKRSRQQGDQGRMDSEFGGSRCLEETGGAQSSSGGGGAQGQTKLEQGITKGGNDKIGMVQSRSEVLEKGWMGRSDWDLTGMIGIFFCHLSLYVSLHRIVCLETRASPAMCL